MSDLVVVAKRNRKCQVIVFTVQNEEHVNICSIETLRMLFDAKFNVQIVCF